MKFASICLLLVCTVVSTVLASDDINSAAVDPVLGEKKILCVIDFQPDSYTLSEIAISELDRVVDQLKRIDTQYEAIRIEGFVGEKDTYSGTTELSMLRALAVEDYLRVHHDARFDRYLTGHKNVGPDCRVTIYVYKNPWIEYDAPIQLTSRGTVDGPS